MKWPVHVACTNGDKEGEVQNLSIDGAFLQFSDRPNLNNNFKIVLKPSEHQLIPITAEKIWAANFNIDGKRVFSGVGVRFTEICEADREFLRRATAI